MTGFPKSPKLLKGGIVLIDSETTAVKKIIVLQYNPETLSRSLAVQSVSEGGSRSEALRLTGPPVETFKIDAEIDATDRLEFPDQHPNSVEFGIFPEIAILEMLVYPKTAQLTSNDVLAGKGILEIVPMESDLTLFVWGKQRVVPVRVTDFSVSEEDFDANLNPIRAKVSLGMRVLTVDDLGFDHKGGSLYMVYQRQKEKLAGKIASGDLSSFGIGDIS